MFISLGDFRKVLDYAERSKDHWRNGEAVTLFNNWPAEVRALARPLLTGPYPDEAAVISAWKQAQEILSKSLAAKQEAMKARLQSLPEKPKGSIRPRGIFRALSCDCRYRINKWGEVVGPLGESLQWKWDLLTAIPSVKIGGKKKSILSLLQDVGFQKRKERKTVPKPAPVVNDAAEAAAEDPEANPPKGFDSWAEAQGEDPETFGFPN
jgi:hypothetical protein